MKYLFFALLFSYPQTALCQQTIIINNDKPRYDTNGKIVDAHDGRVIQFGKKFYWYGTSYGTTNGFTKANKSLVLS